jgi:site-specific recombinase XerD
MSGELVPLPSRQSAALARSAQKAPPTIVERAGGAARFAWEEVFLGEIPNADTRKAYMHAVRKFLAWCEARGADLWAITPGMVGEYFGQHPDGPATKKQHLAAIRKLFDKLVVRHVVAFNPAHSVRTERYRVIEGKTPEIMVPQAEKLLASIDASNVVGLRDRAVIAVLIFKAARVGAVSKLRLKHFEHDGSQWTLRFEEKGGKSREIPVRHDLQGLILAYRAAVGLDGEPRESPLFRTAAGRSRALTMNRMTAIDICRLVKRRLKDAGLPSRLCPHSFRVMTITDLLEHGSEMEEVQYLAGHADSRTTALYDRRKRRVTRNIVERISVRIRDRP